MERKRSKHLRPVTVERYGKQEELFEVADRGQTTVPTADPLSELPLLSRAIEAHSGETHALNKLLKERVEQSDAQDPSLFGRFFLDPTGLIVEANQVGADLLGADRKELPQQPFVSFVAGGSRDRFAAYFRRVVAKCKAGDSELEMEKADSRLFYARISSTPFMEDGRVTAVYSVISDVTRQREAQEAFRESEERYRIVAENSSDGMIIVSSTQTLLYANPKCLHMFGYSKKEEILGDSILAIVHPDDRDRVMENSRRGQRGEHPAARWEFKGLRKDGGMIYVEASPNKTTYKREAASLVFLHDITERRQAEEERRRLSMIVEQAPEMILVLDSGGSVQYANIAFLRNSGRKSEDLIGLHILQCATEGNRGFYDALWTKLQRGRRSTGRLTFRRQDGSFKEFDVTVAPMRNASGEVINQVVTCRDVTAEAMLEQQLRQAHKMEAIGTLAGGIAHDFNNILAVIIGNAELALDDVPVGSDPHHNIEQIFKASQRARDLVKQILTFSRPDNRAAVLVEAGPVVVETMRLLRSSIPATIEISYGVEPGRNTVLADSARLQQILMNLCANAAHAMREKGGVLEVTLEEYEAPPPSPVPMPALKPGPYLVITVRDTGIGMSEDVMERIFDPFFTTKRPGEGTGMGLAVVHGIVKSLNGIVTVSSQPGKGSTFSVYLPSAPNETERTMQGEALPLPGGKERILFVDDEKSIVEMNLALLERLGYRVTAVSNSREALDLFRSAPRSFDLVITDQTMPGLTGAELAKRIRAQREDIPVILMTGFSETLDADRARRIGVRQLLMKPIIKRELAEAIRKVMDGAAGEK